jgi:hypothetical protein
VTKSEPNVGEGKLRIPFDRLLEKLLAGGGSFTWPPVPRVETSQVELVRFWIDLAAGGEMRLLLRTQSHADLVRGVLRDITLHSENITHIALVVPRPEVSLVADPNELGANAHPVARATYTALQDVVHAQLTSDLRGALLVLLYFIAEVRAITTSLSGCRLPSCVIISSVSPSLKYSCRGSPLKFWKGSTANMILLEDGLTCVQKRCRPRKPASSNTKGSARAVIRATRLRIITGGAGSRLTTRFCFLAASDRSLTSAVNR